MYSALLCGIIHCMSDNCVVSTVSRVKIRASSLVMHDPSQRLNFTPDFGSSINYRSPHSLNQTIT